MKESVPLQEVLGASKKNPFLTICKSSCYPGKLLVLFGTALLEIVQDDPTHPNFKLLLARLYNSGVKVKSLTDAFEIPYTTLRRWGNALKSGDAEQLMRVLAGRQHPRKLSTEILSFSRYRFNAIYPEDNYRYSQRILAEILEVFKVSISSELLRPHFTQWKCGLKTASDLVAAIVVVEQGSDLNDEVQLIQNVPPATDEVVVEAVSQPSENDCLVAQLAAQVPSPVASVDNNRKQTVATLVKPTATSETGYQFFPHAGMLLFSALLNAMAEKLGNGRALITQWLVAVLLGAINIEQSKRLNWLTLQIMLGDVVVNLNKQRQELGQLALAGGMEKVLQINGEAVGIGQGRDFYYDPHSKHYTGAHKILKGWCSRLRFAEKVLHMDFIHTALGFPVYIFHDDNYQDLRVRFIKVVNAFRAQFGFGSKDVLTFVVDRGIYGIECFENIMAQDDKTYFVTWEKDYKGDLTKTIPWSGQVNLYKEKNSSKTRRCYAFCFYQERWPRNNAIRRLIVRATNPKGRTIEVAVLSNDLNRPAAELIELIFTRWIQENDFKYLDVHFGINEITSYETISYQELEKNLDDKQEKNGLYKALVKQRLEIKKKLQKRLLQKHCYPKKNLKQQHDIDQLTEQLAEISEKIGQTDKEVSRLTRLVEAGFHKLDTSKKSLMDAIKIMARNMFYLLLQPFKEAYDNYRDDHVLFRDLTRSPGFVRFQGNVVQVLLIPHADLPPKVIGIIEGLLAQINNRSICLPDQSGRVLNIRLLHNENVHFEIQTKGSSVFTFPALI